MAVALIASVLVVALGAAPASAAGDTITMTTFRDIEVDPATGTVFVSGDDQVAVFDAAGVHQSTITGVFGAGGMDIVGTKLWVAETTAGKLAEIDIASRAVVREVAVGSPVTGASLAHVNGYVYFANGGQLRRLNLATSTASTRGNVLQGEFERVGSTNTLLTYGLGATSVAAIDVSGFPAVVGLFGPGGQNLRQIAVDPSSATYAFASGAPYVFGEVSIPTMSATGVEYEGTYYPSSIAYSPGHGGLYVGGTQSTNQIFVSTVGASTAAATVTLPGYLVDRGVAVSADGNRVYAIHQPSYATASTTKALATIATGPSASAVIPSQVVADVPTPVSVTGKNLDIITSASVGGLTAVATPVSPTKVTVTMPVGLPVGPTTLHLETPLGTTSIAMTVVANTGGALTGTVRLGATPIAGVELELSGGALATPVSTVTGADGGYGFLGLGYGTTYRLEAHDPSGASVDQAIGALTVTPNGTTVRDLALTSTQTGPGAILASTPIGGQARDLLVEPTTDRTFVTVGDEVLVFDHDGGLIARFANQWAADALTADGTDVYVNLRTVGTIVRFDAATLTITGSWPTQRLTTGGLAFAGDRLWFSNGNNQWTSISSLDPATGTVVDTAGSWYQPRFRSVEGAPGLLYLWQEGVSPASAALLDASDPVAVGIQYGWFNGTGGAASGSLGRFWTNNGREYDLDTFLDTGVQYPTSVGTAYGTGAVAFSLARGGTIGMGATVAQFGEPIATHTVPAEPIARGFDSDADRIMYATFGGSFVVMDLHPHLVSVGPAPIFDDATSLTLTGSGLATTSEVEIDGTSYPFTTTGTNTVTVTVPGFTSGLHAVHVVTDWGPSEPLSFLTSPRPPAPTVTGISPATVPTKGGSVTITGTGLADTTAVTFGTTAATSVSVVDDTTVIATAPAHLPGSASVTVTTPWGTNSSSPPFAWVAPVPVVTSISPAGGPVTGGTTVTVTGTGFTFASAVTVGGTPAANVNVISDTKITLRTPAHASGEATVSVTTPGGTSLANPGATFTYSATLPVISSISPADGVTAGGYQVLISGQNLLGTSEVSFGGEPATTFTTIGSTTIVAVVPPGSAGAVDVLVTTAQGTSVPGPASTFTYRPIGSAFHGITPTRVLDSRMPTGGWDAKLDAGAPRTLLVAGTNGIPADATAVVINIAATDPDAESFLTAYPTGTAPPNASNLNFGFGQTIANLATVRVGTGGTITFANAVGSTNVVVDVVGYYRQDEGELFTGITPNRVLDSRTDTGWTGRLSGGDAAARNLVVTGGDVPASADSLVLNVTATDSTNDSFLQLWPTGSPRPSSSSVNFVAGSVTSNLVTVKIGTGGAVSFFNAVGSTNVVADIVGYYDDEGDGSAFFPLAGPERFLDSRFGVGTSGSWTADESRLVGVGSHVGVPAGASAIVFNATVTNGTSGSYLTVYPPEPPRPGSSSLNFSPGQTVANLAVVAVEPHDAVAIYNNLGTVDVIGDVVGYFATE